MPNGNSTGENNRANEGNQSSRHHHSRSQRPQEKGDSQKPSNARLNEQSPAHEYYPQFDHSGKGINPYKPIKRH